MDYDSPGVPSEFVRGNQHPRKIARDIVAPVVTARRHPRSIVAVVSWAEAVGAQADA
jgi:hypothetical protein